MAVNLKLGDRLAIIRDGVKKGLTPQQAMLQYQINKDGGYNNWKNQFKQSTGVDPDLDDTYNYELFFKENPEAAKQLLLGKVSPKILEMYKTPLAIQREKQVLLQRQKGNINSLMDYSLYEKLINDYMNKSVNVSAYGGNINMFVDGGETASVSEPISESASTTNKDDNEITKHERFTQTELEPNKWRTQRLPDFIELTPEELQDIKNYVLEMAYKEDTNKPFRIFHIPKEVIVKYHPELENVSMQNPGFYIYEDEYQDALKNGKKYLRLKWLRESSKEGKLFDEWKKLRKMLYLYDTDRNYANFTDGDTLELEDNAEKNYNLLPNVVVAYDKGTQQQILPQEEPEELEIEPIRSGSVAIEPDITKIVQVEDKKLPPLTPTENTLKYIDMSGTTGEELKVFNNNPLNTEGVPGGSSFGNSADGTRIPDVFNLYDNYNYNVPYEDFSTYQPEGYQYQPWNIYNLQSSGYVDIPNWNVQQIQDNGDNDKFLNFLNMLANIPQKSDNTDLLMTLLMLPKDYFADPYAGEHYTNTTNFYDVYNNNPYTKIQRESNGTPLYKSGGRINKFEVGGEPSIEELALQRALLATSPKSNYHKAIDFVYDPISAMKMAYDKGLSNCTLTASLFYDPEKPITKARTIVTTPHVSGFYEVGEDYAVPGSMVIASLPNGNDYGKNSYHTMILSGYADQDYQFPFKGKVYDVKKGEPLVNYSKGKREPENYIKNIPLKAYLDNSDGKTNVRYYRPYNNDLKAKLLPEIVVTPEGNYILNYLNKNANILAKGGRVNKFETGGNKTQIEENIYSPFIVNGITYAIVPNLVADTSKGQSDLEGNNVVGKTPVYVKYNPLKKKWENTTMAKDADNIRAYENRSKEVGTILGISEDGETLYGTLPDLIVGSVDNKDSLPATYDEKAKSAGAYDPYNNPSISAQLNNLFNSDPVIKELRRRIFDTYLKLYNASNFLNTIIPAHLADPMNYLGAAGEYFRGNGNFFLNSLSGNNKGMFSLSDNLSNWAEEHPYLSTGANLLGSAALLGVGALGRNIALKGGIPLSPGYRYHMFLPKGNNFYYRIGDGIAEDAVKRGKIIGRMTELPFFLRGRSVNGKYSYRGNRDILLRRETGKYEWPQMDWEGNLVDPNNVKTVTMPQGYTVKWNTAGERPILINDGEVTPMINGLIGIADSRDFQLIKPINIKGFNIGYIERPLIK